MRRWRRRDHPARLAFSARPSNRLTPSGDDRGELAGRDMAAAPRISAKLRTKVARDVSRRAIEAVKHGHSASAAATLAFSTGNTSASNHGFWCIHNRLRQAGCGSGNSPAGMAAQLRTAALRLGRRALGR